MPARAVRSPDAAAPSAATPSPATKARKSDAVRLDSRAKRKDLPARGKPYFVPAGASRSGASLGYRRNKRGAGTWVARLKIGAAPVEHVLGPADDDGAPAGALPFATALTLVIEWCAAERKRREAGAPAGPNVPTVDAVARDYLAALGAAAAARNADRDAGDTAAVLAKHLIGGGKLRHQFKPLASRRLDRVTRGDLQDWLRGLDSSLSPASVARILNTVRALLRGAWARAGHATPAGWDALVRDGLNTKNAKRPAAGPARQVEDVRPDILTDADVRRLLDACAQVDDDLHRLMVVLAATGLRFSQVIRMRVRDVDRDNAVLSVPVSAKGDTLAKETTNKPQLVRVHVAPDVLAVLAPAVNGRRGDEPLLMRDHHMQPAGSAKDGRGEWREGKDGRRVWVAERITERRPWLDTAQLARPLAKALAVAQMPAAVSTYHLRDWSIIRLLRAGLDPVTVARRHDTSVAMIERNYGRHILSAQETALRAAAPVLSSGSVATLRAVV